MRSWLEDKQDFILEKDRNSGYNTSWKNLI